jgi:hypothetical protein
MKRMKNKSRKFGKSILALACSLIFGLGLVSNVSAENKEVPDFTRTGSISVTLMDKQYNENLTDGELTIYQVAEAVADDGKFSYSLVNGFENSGIDLGDLSGSGLPSQMETYITSSTASSTAQVNGNGEAKFENLQLGVYLVVQTKASTGYNAVSSFLVSVPMYDENGSCIYDVDATPKVEAFKNSVSITPSPTVPPTIPQTGQLFWPIAVLAIAGMLIFALGWMLRRSKDSHEA